MIGSTTIINGSLDVSGSGSISFTGVTSPSGAALLTVQGCATINGTITVTLTTQETQHIQQQPGKSKDVNLLTADCGSIQNPIVQVNSDKKSCKRVTSKSQTNPTQTGGYSLVATFHVDTSKCNTWWIVLVSVIGGIILIAIVLALLATFTPLKQIVRPFTKRNQAQI